MGERVTDAEAALTLAGVDVGDLLDEDGEVDPAAVAEVAGRVMEARPYLRPAAHHMDLGPKKAVPQRNSASWDRLMRGK